MILHDIYIELVKIRRELERMGRRMDQLTPEERPADEWIQKGLDSIIGFQAGKKGAGE